MRNGINRWLQLFFDSISELCDNNVKIILSRTDTIYIPEEGVHVNGFWDDTDEKKLVFAYATGQTLDNWGPIFAHEFCHFLQWKDKEQIWYDYKNITTKESFDIYHNLPISQERLDFCLDATREIELDCEKRTVQLFKKYKIPIDIKNYIRGANAYIHFYNHIKKYRQWYPPGKMPYARKRLKEVASSRFYKDYNEIPLSMAELYKRYYPEKKKNKIIV
jgi:hypothetical protein